MVGKCENPFCYVISTESGGEKWSLETIKQTAYFLSINASKDRNIFILG